MTKGYSLERPATRPLQPFRRVYTDDGDPFEMHAPKQKVKSVYPASTRRCTETAPHPSAKVPALGLSFQRAVGNQTIGKLIQTKLTVNQPGDRYEREADRVADAVMRMPLAEAPESSPRGPRIQKKCAACTSAQGLCPECEAEEAVQRKALPTAGASGIRRQSEEEEEPLQAKEATGRTPAVTPGLQARIQSLRGGGQPLPKSEHAFFEPRFGYNFRQVQVHRDSRAAATAQALGARAFTISGDVFFARGHFRPGTEPGRRLLAHELVHVVQQGSAAPLPAAGSSVAGMSSGVRFSTESAIERLQRASDPPSSATPTCPSAGSRIAPDHDAIEVTLVESGILQDSGRSSDFSNILLRHVKGKSRIGSEYLDFLLDHAYPMQDFCITYGGRGWNRTFLDVLRFYEYKRPRHRDMRLVERTIRAHDRTHLLIYDEVEMFSGGLRDPFAAPLTPIRLRRKASGTVLAGSPPEALLLLLATDKYLSSLTVTAGTVSGTTPEPATSGTTTQSAIFGWAAASVEGTIGDPSRFDALIVQWTNHFNEIFRPVNRGDHPDPLDPDLVKAMIFVESRFSETAAAKRSSAQGLTQVLSRERRKVGELPAGVSGISDTNFGDPAVQIATGIRILFEKYRRSRNWATAIRDYNGGPRKDAYRDRVLEVYRSHRRSL